MSEEMRLLVEFERKVQKAVQTDSKDDWSEVLECQYELQDLNWGNHCQDILDKYKHEVDTL